MSEANKKIVRDFFAAMDSKRFDDMRALLHPDHKFNLPLAPEPMGLEAHMEMNMKLQHSLSDFDRHFYDQIAEGDKVVVEDDVVVKGCNSRGWEGTVIDVWTGCDIDPPCCCNELATDGAITVTFEREVIGYFEDCEVKLVKATGPGPAQ